jgi:hypothetical protein
MHDDDSSSLRLTANRIERAVSEYFSVYDVTLGSREQPQVIRLRGHLQVPADRAHPEIAARLRELGYTAVLRRDEQVGLDELLAIPGSSRDGPLCGQPPPWGGS